MKGKRWSDLTIKEWLDEDRPREKLFKYSERSLSDSELLAIIINVGTKEKNAATLCKFLIHQFGSLAKLAEADAKALAKISGIGPAKAARIKAAFELGRRSSLQQLIEKNPVLNSPDKVAHFARLKIGPRKKEVFLAIFLDIKIRVIDYKFISIGTLTHALIHPREIFKEAVLCSAASIIIVHNHPSGSAEPSEEDIHLTERLCRAGQILGIHIIDHIILGSNTFFSFAKKDLL